MHTNHGAIGKQDAPHAASLSNGEKSHARLRSRPATVRQSQGSQRLPRSLGRSRPLVVATLLAVLVSLILQGVRGVGIAPAFASGAVAVEAYLFQVNGPTDFGDAPTATQSGFSASYPTTLAGSGASHTITSTLRIGAQIDAEADGQPTVGADGDDTTGTPDDEDGMAVLVPLGPGRLGALRVGVQTPTNTPARISIWIDYNQDGDFGDAGEQIANDGFVVGPSALTYSSYGVEVSVPTGAATGFTYARVRYCSAVNTCNTPGGSAPDGEVEDYRIEIVNTATLGDRVWRDINADGIQDPGEPNVEGVLVRLYRASDNTLVNAALTDSSGNYLFQGLLPDTYYVEFVPPAGYSFTAASQGSDPAKDSNADPGTGRTPNIPLSPGANDLTWDAGLLSSADGLTFCDMIPWQRTNINHTFLLPKFDPALGQLTGVSVTSLLGTRQWVGNENTANQGGEVEITVSARGRLTLPNSPPLLETNTSRTIGPRTFITFDGIIDYSGTSGFADPDWDYRTNTASQAYTPINDFIAGSPNATVSLPLTVTSAFSLDGGGGNDSTTVRTDATAGVCVRYTYEAVEDWGDAPTAAQSGFAASYPTTLANNGARHTIAPDLRLGKEIDAEADGQPTVGADGDDTTGTPDDEEGVQFHIPLRPGDWAEITAGTTQPVNTNARISLWLDFNRDGDWTDPGEQVANDRIAIGGSRINANTTSFTILVPATASPGATYARARLCLNANECNTPTGAAADGEVEDYLVQIANVAKLGDRVWLDTNGNGIQDSGETGVPGVQVNVYRASDNTLVDSTFTDGSGLYLFPTLVPDTYYVEFVKPSGYTFTAPNLGGNPAADSDANQTTGKTANIILPGGADDRTWDAGLVRTAGTLTFCAALPNWQVTEVTHTFLLDKFDPALGVLTGVQIEYYLGGKFLIGGENRADSVQNIRIQSKSDGALTLPNASLATNTVGVDTGVLSLGAYDGVTDYAGPSGFFSPDWQFNLDSSSQAYTPLVDFIGAGQQASLPFATLSSLLIQGGGGQTAGVQRTYAKAGVCVRYTYEAKDWGDAPDTGAGTGVGNYNTLATDSGPSHVIVPNLQLGANSPDNDPGTLQDAPATADDTTGTPDDEDGVTAPTIFTNDTSVDLDVSALNNTGAAATLACWIDFDKNGVFANTGGERRQVAAPSQAGAQNFTLTFTGFTTPLTVGDTYIRCRIANDAAQVANSTGGAQTGEVEDYKVTIESPPPPPPTFDWGDLPASYGTEFVDDGPRHVVGGPVLGATVDSDFDGQPGPGADGDDIDPPAGPDDEDGVATLPGVSTTSTSVPLSVSVLSTSASTLACWIDFNRDGDFLDSGERASAAVGANASQQTISLTFSGFAPPTAGVSYLRCRIANAAGEVALPTGEAASGEVEDYRVTIATPSVLIGDHIWRDNGTPDGIYQGTDTNLAGVPVTVTSSSNVQYLATTNGSGIYTVSVPANDTYTVTYGVPAGLVPSATPAGTDTGPGTNDQSHTNGLQVTVTTTGNLNIDFALKAPTQPIFDLALLKTVSFAPTPIVAGQSKVTFQIQVRNQGDVAAANIVVVDYVQPGFEYDPADNNGWTQAATTTPEYTIPGVLQPGASIPVNIVLRVTAAAVGTTIANLAEIAAATNQGGQPAVDVDSTPDKNPDNDVLVPGVVDNTGGDEDDHDKVQLSVPSVRLGNLVWNDINNNGVVDVGELGFPNVKVELYREVSPGLTQKVAEATTDANGLYLFNNLIPGRYVMVLAPPAGFPASSTPTTDADNGVDNDDNGLQDAIGGQVRSPIITLAPGTEPDAAVDGDDKNGDMTVDFGFYTPVNLGNQVWHDANGNGLLDSGETGIPNVTVQLFRAGDDPATATPLATTATDGSGVYRFANLSPGQYFVYISTPPAAYPTSSTPTRNSDNGVDNDDNGVQNASGQPVRSPVITLLAGTEPTNDGDGANGDLTVDFGFYAPLNLGNQVWHDANDNGVQDGSETGIADVRVELYAVGQTPGVSTPVAIAVTDNAGIYSFANLQPGQYFVYMPEPPAAYPTSSSTTATTDNNVDDDDNGSQATTGAPVTSPLVTLTSGGEPGAAVDGDGVNGNLTLDFGFYRFDLALRKTVTSISTGSLVTGTTLVTYAIEVFNQGDLAATNVTVVDFVPAGLEFDQSLNTTQWTAVSGEPGKLTTTIAGPIQPGTSATVSIVLRVGASVTSDQTLTNAAEIADDNQPPGTEADSTPDREPNNDAPVKDDEIDEDGKNVPDDDEDDHDVATVVLNNFDLALRKQVASQSHTPLLPGVSTVTFVFDVFNQGSVIASNITLVEYVPAGLVYEAGLNTVTWTPDAITPEKLTTTIAGPLAAGQSTTVTVVLRVAQNTAGQTIVNAGEIVSATDSLGNPVTDADSTPDTDSNNDGPVKDDAIDNSDGDEDDHDIAEIEVGTFDLALRKVLAAGQPARVETGSEVTFTVEIYNQGDIAATNIRIVDTLPDGFVLSPFDKNGWVEGANNTVALTLAGPLAGGASTSVNLRTVAETVTPMNINDVEVASALGPNGEALIDVDSTPDSTVGNDIVVDDEIDNAGNDEDDHDIEPVEVYVIEVRLLKTLADGQVATVKPEDDVNFVIRVENKGNSLIQSLTIVDRFPLGTSFSANAQNAPWTLAADGRSATRTVGPLQPGQIIAVTIVLRVDANVPSDTTLLNVAEIIEIRDETSTPTDENNPPSGSSDDLLLDNIDDEPIQVVVPTAIGLVNFTAARVGDVVQVDWESAYENNTFGYHIYRGTTDNFADAAAVTKQIVPGQGTGGGNYQFVDTTVVSGAPYRYWLVEVEVSGATNVYGPVRVSLLGASTPNNGVRAVFLPVISKR